LAAGLRRAALEAGRGDTPLRLVSRGTVRMYAAAQGRERRPLWGSLDEIREDIRRYAEGGLTELFLDPNFDPSMARAPDAATAMERAMIILETFAPDGQDVS
jgi:hypothetical protein